MAGADSLIPELPSGQKSLRQHAQAIRLNAPQALRGGR